MLNPPKSIAREVVKLPLFPMVSGLLPRGSLLHLGSFWLKYGKGDVAAELSSGLGLVAGEVKVGSCPEVGSLPGFGLPPVFGPLFPLGSFPPLGFPPPEG